MRVDMNDETLMGRYERLAREYCICDREREDYSRKLGVKNVWLNAIISIGSDYDGCNTVESLKGLIDELVYYAEKGWECNNTNPAYDDFEKLLGD